MRRLIALVVPLLLLAACGGNEEQIANKRQTLKKIERQSQQLNEELADKLKAWGAAKLKVIPARKEWLRAKQNGDSDAEAAAKAALDEVQAKANEVTGLEMALKARINELRGSKNRLKDEIRRLGGTP